jgi:hypothetical protein
MKWWSPEPTFGLSRPFGTKGYQAMPEEIVRKLEARALASEAGASLKPVQDRQIVVRVEARSLEMMRKEAVVKLERPQGSSFAIICDEGAYLGGDDTAPPPLSYFSAGIAF